METFIYCIGCICVAVSVACAVMKTLDHINK